MVPVGVVGLSPAWEQRYRPAILSLRSRIDIRAIYDPVLSRAEQAAGLFEADVLTGMRVLARRSDIKALLVFDGGWCGRETIRLLCQTGRPLFLGGAIGTDAGPLDRLCAEVADCGVTVMPELGQRYTPATMRLRELIATQLGPPVRMTIEAEAPAVPPDGQPLGSLPWNGFVSGLLDWCCAVLPTRPTEVEMRASPTGGPETIHILFARPRSGGETPAITIQIHAGTTASATRPPVFHVECVRGRAEIRSAHRIVWHSLDQDGDEHLTAERNDLQVMLDHFCRRVVGGLIPVADLTDIRRAWILAEAAAESLKVGRAIRLTDSPGYSHWEHSPEA